MWGSHLLVVQWRPKLGHLRELRKFRSDFFLLGCGMCNTYPKCSRYALNIEGGGVQCTLYQRLGFGLKSLCIPKANVPTVWVGEWALQRCGVVKIGPSGERKAESGFVKNAESGRQRGAPKNMYATSIGAKGSRNHQCVPAVLRGFIRKPASVPVISVDAPLQ